MSQPKTWLQDAFIPPEPDGHFVMIPLTQGKFTIVDEADAESVLRVGSWCAIRAPHTWYAGRGKPRIHVHAMIGGSGADHANRNGLDNRRVNLRPATASQQQANRRPFSNNTSGYKGVCLRQLDRKWVAHIQVDGRKRYLGSFADAADAARAYNRGALEAFGEYAWLNPVPPAPEVPPEVPPEPAPPVSDPEPDAEVPEVEEERPTILLSRRNVRPPSPTWLEQAGTVAPPMAGIWQGVSLHFPLPR